MSRLVAAEFAPVHETAAAVAAYLQNGNISDTI